MQTHFLRGRILHHTVEGHAPVVGRAGQVDPEDRSVRIDLLPTPGKTCTGALALHHVIPAVQIDSDRDMTILRQIRPDVGVNTDHLSLHIKQGPPRITSYHRTIRGDELSIAQDSSQTNRRRAHRIKPSRMANGDTPFIPQEILAPTHLHEGIFSFVRDSHHGRITVEIPSQFFSGNSLAIWKNDDDLISKRGHHVRRCQDQSLLAHDHSASRPPGAVGNQGNRGRGTRLRD